MLFHKMIKAVKEKVSSQMSGIRGRHEEYAKQIIIFQRTDDENFSSSFYECLQGIQVFQEDGWMQC